jgi:hypothetical protein
MGIVPFFRPMLLNLVQSMQINKSLSSDNAHPLSAASREKLIPFCKCFAVIRLKQDGLDFSAPRDSPWSRPKNNFPAAEGDSPPSTVSDQRAIAES